MKEPTLLSINRVAVADVLTTGRLRPVSPAGVASLVASIRETGVMKDAIHVRRKKDGSLHLIAGGHRLAAATALGWTEIEAKVWTDVTDDWARLMEIDDNLAGAEMNALDTAVFLARRKEVYERLHPETKQHVAGAAARWNASDIVSFASATAEKFGVSQRHVERMVAAGRALGPDQTAALRKAPRPVTLKDLTEIGKISDPAERYDVVARLAAGNAKSAAEARRSIAARDETVNVPAKDPVEDAFVALLTAWKRAPMAALRRFVTDRWLDIAELRDDAHAEIERMER